MKRASTCSSIKKLRNNKTRTTLNSFSSTINLRPYTSESKMVNKTYKDLTRDYRSKEWRDNFQVMCSKDNIYQPKGQREFFDKPITYDINDIKTYVNLKA